MRANLVLASALGTAFGAFAVPAIGGPVHYQLTRPYSLFGWIPAVTGSTATTLTLGTAPLDFVLTDVMLGSPANYDFAFVTVNGNRVLNLPRQGAGPQTATHLTSGIFIAAGSAVGILVNAGTNFDTNPVTLAGYVQ